MSASAVDLISKLLIKDSQTRLQDPESIKNHEFFQGIDWEAMMKKELRPPYVPQLQNDQDTNHFD